MCCLSYPEDTIKMPKYFKTFGISRVRVEYLVYPVLRYFLFQARDLSVDFSGAYASAFKLGTHLITLWREGHKK